jgi:hypothetical protein
MRLTALGGANCELQAALAAEQARVEQAGRQLAGKDQVGRAAARGAPQPGAAAAARGPTACRARLAPTPALRP